MTQTETVRSSSFRELNRFENPMRLRVRLGFILSFIGLFVFVVGAKPNWLGLDRSPVVGFVQIAIFLVGLGITCLGGYLGLIALWNGSERTIAADIGSRLVGTGYVIAVFSGMADVFGMGSQPLPQIPYFGPWQAAGVLIGQVVIALGFLLLIPYHPHHEKQRRQPHDLEP